MSRAGFTFIHLADYVDRSRRIGLDDETQREIESAILNRPDVGAVMAGTGGLRKFRVAAARAAGIGSATRSCPPKSSS